MEKEYIQLTKEQFIEKFFSTGALFYSKENNKILNRFSENGKLICYYYEATNEEDEQDLLDSLNNKRHEYSMNLMKKVWSK